MKRGALAQGAGAPSLPVAIAVYPPNLSDACRWWLNGNDGTDRTESGCLFCGQRPYVLDRRNPRASCWLTSRHRRRTRLDTNALISMIPAFTLQDRQHVFISSEQSDTKKFQVG